MSSSQNQTGPKIAIIGGGPVSLTLANILQNNSIPFTVYEASSSFRTSGGTLDLHPESGQLALREAGLHDEFKKYARPEGDALKLLDIFGKLHWDENTVDKQDTKTGEEYQGRPEIDRSKLMELLFQNLNKDNIKFGKKLQEVLPNSTSSDAAPTYDLHFADSTTIGPFNAVIGGEGAWSRVRSLLTPVRPQYSGISTIEIWVNDLNANTWLSNFVGSGSCFGFGEGCAIQCQRQGDGQLRTYASLRVPENFFETSGIDWSKGVEARKEYLEKFFPPGLGEDLKRVVLETGDEVTPRKLYELPVGFRWPSLPGVTLIGDAAHLMTPFAGVGVNVGMTDSLVLGKEIIAAWNGEKRLDEALKAYEEEMWPRAEVFMKKTMKGKISHFSEHGAEGLADMLKAHHYGENK
jgi:2-polyprenyl-6-methoxyphenol hydroxylase-like FAD-dependent oxidoreductase